MCDIPTPCVFSFVDADFPLRMQVKISLDFRVANSVVNLAVLPICLKVLKLVEDQA